VGQPQHDDFTASRARGQRRGEVWLPAPQVSRLPHSSTPEPV